MKSVVATSQAPAAVGPYSQAIMTAGLIFTAGQLGINPLTGKLAEGVEAQTHQAMRNLQAVLESVGSSLDRVLKTTIFVTDLGDFRRINAIYGSYFKDAPPARSTVQVAALPLGGLVEIEMIAEVD